MRTSPFYSKYRITQVFGNDPIYYSQWGFAGHEGLDCVPYAGDWDILSVEDGEVVRDIDDTRDNYGKHVVVVNWENLRAWWYCHMEYNTVKVGDIVGEGQIVGKMGTTGASTGPHLHLAVRKCDKNGNAIDINNGYKGFINPLPILQGGIMDCLLSNTDADRKTFEGLVSKSSKYDEFANKGYFTVADVNTLVADLRKSVDDKSTEAKAAESLAEDYRVEWKDFLAVLADDYHLRCRQDKTEITSICADYNRKIGELEDLGTTFANYKNISEGKESELNAEVNRLTELLKHENVLDNVKTSDLIKEIVKRLVHIIDRG